VHITATLSGHTSLESSANSYTYAIFPTVSGVTPNSGAVTGGIPVTVTGTNFSTASGATTFKFDTLNATNVSCASATQCTMTAPVRAPNAGYLGAGVTATVDGHTSTQWVLFSFGSPTPPPHPQPSPDTKCQ